MHHSAVYVLEVCVKLLVGALPAVVAPEIVSGLATDAFLQLPEVNVRDVELGLFLGFACQQAELTIVVATTYAGHVTIEHGLVEVASQLLGAREHGGVVMEEVHPVVDAVPLWRLVGYVAGT